MGFIKYDECWLEEKTINRLLLYFFLNIMAMNFLHLFLPGKFVNIIQVTTLMGFIWKINQLSSLKNIENKYLKYSFIIFTLWVAYIIKNGLILNYFYIKEYLFEPYRFLQYIIPFIILIPLSSRVFIQKIIYCCHLFGSSFLLLLPICIMLKLYNDQTFTENYIWFFASGSGFILLTSNFYSKKKVFISVIVVFIALMLATILARRNIMVTYLSFIFVSFYIYLFHKKDIAPTKKIVAMALSIVLLTACYSVFLSGQQTFFKKINDRAMDNSREEVLFGYFAEMNENTNNWIFGKGLNGTYYAPGIDEGFLGYDLDYRDLDDRLTIESGYLQLILNGGIVYLLLFLAILLPAIIKGLFFSRNLFVRGCSSLVFLWLIDMFPFGLPSFSFRYFLVWFCISICYSKKIRMMDDDEIRNFINPDNNEDIIIN